MNNLDDETCRLTPVQIGTKLPYNITNMCIDMCADMCVDMCTDVCVDVCIDMRIDMRAVIQWRCGPTAPLGGSR